VDQTVAAELLRVVGAPAVDAAIETAERMDDERAQQCKAKNLELEQARSEVQLAERRYESVDPDNLLGAAQLAAKWNLALARVAHLEAELQEQTKPVAHDEAVTNRAALHALASDLEAVWHAPSSDQRIKQRIARILVREIVVDLDGKSNEVILMIHWTGGRHSEVRVAKNKSGHTSRWTDPDALKVIRRMAGKWSDREIALTLNRMGLRSGTGLTWTEVRVFSVRHRMGLPAHDPSKQESSRVSLDEAAKILGVSNTVVRRLIKDNLLPCRPSRSGRSVADPTDGSCLTGGVSGDQGRAIATAGFACGTIRCRDPCDSWTLRRRGTMTLDRFRGASDSVTTARCSRRSHGFSSRRFLRSTRSG
jgi:hypothetical protein